MDLKQHEKWIREETLKGNPSIDTSALWSAVESHVPQKKRRGIFYLLLPLGLLLGFGAAWMLNPNRLESIKPSTTIASNDDIGIAELEYNSQPITSPINSDNTEFEDDIIEAKPTNLKTITSSLSTNTTVDNLLPSNKNVTQYPTHSQQNGLAKNRHQNLNLATGPLSNISTNNINDKHLLTNDSNLLANEQFVTESLNQHLRISEVLPTSFIDNLGETPAIIQEQSTQTIPTLYPQKPAREKPFTIAISQGINMGTDKILSKGLWDDLYDNITTRLPGNATTAAISYNFNNRWSVVAGLHYDQIVYRYSSSFSEKKQREVSGIDQYLIDASGMINAQEGIITIYETTTKDGRWHSYNENFSSSLGLEYKLFTQNRWTILTEGGVMARLYLRTSGYILGERSESLQVLETKTDWNSSIQFQAYGKVGAMYAITNDIQMGINYRFSIQENKNSLNILTNNTMHTIGLSCAYSL